MIKKWTRGIGNYETIFKLKMCIAKKERTCAIEIDFEQYQLLVTITAQTPTKKTQSHNQ